MASEETIIECSSRIGSGKSEAKVLRKQGFVPAVVSGDKKQSLNISLSEKKFFQTLDAGGYKTTVYTLLSSDKKIKESVLTKRINFHPVKNQIQHIEFLRVDLEKTIEIEIPLRAVNHDSSPGLRKGGILNMVRHSIYLKIVAKDIPEYLEVDLSGLEIGDSIHVSKVVLPQGAELVITDRDFTLATISGVKEETKVEEVEDEAEDLETEEEDKDKAKDNDEKKE